MDMMLRKCTKCGLEAWELNDLLLFVRAKNSTHGRWNQCKKCHSKYIMEQRAKLQAIADEAKDVPCVDCGNRFPSVCMDFDHTDVSTKVGTVSGLIRKSAKPDIIKEEIAKCEVVCANCHRIRTWDSDRPYPNTGAVGV